VRESSRRPRDAQQPAEAAAADALEVVVAPRNETGSFGPKSNGYDDRFGNVTLAYGGMDEALQRGVKAAVTAIRGD
jgi:hypothetical protein